MNVTIHIFGRLGGDYTQYPNGDSKSIFDVFENNIKSQTQILICRLDTIIHYGYIRKLSQDGKYIGLCFSFNGVMCTDIHELKKLCDECITQWVVNGDILEFSDNGSIISKVDKLYKTASEFNRLSDNLRIQIEASNIPFEVLPPINFAINSNTSKSFSFNNHNSTINKALNDYNNIYIYGDSSSKTLTSYADKLSRLNSENEQLKAENAKINRQKKRTTIVSILAILIAIGVIVFYFYAQSKNIEINNLNTKNDQLLAKNYRLELHVDTLQKDSLKTHRNFNRAVRKINSLRKDSIKLEQRVGQLQADSSTLQNELIDSKKKIISYLSEIKTKQEKLDNQPPIIQMIEVAGIKTDRRTVIQEYGSNIYSTSNYIKVRASIINEGSAGYKKFTLKLYRSYSGTYYDMCDTKQDEIYLYSSSSKSTQEFPSLLSDGNWLREKCYYKIEICYKDKIIETAVFYVNKK